VLILVVSVDYNRNGLMGGYFLQEGFARLWRGTNAGLALAVPTVSSYFMLFFFFFFFCGGWGRIALLEFAGCTKLCIEYALIEMY
jgi:hypothetical protein